MKIRKILLPFVAVLAVVSSAHGATITFDNFNVATDGAYGIRDDGGILVTGAGFSGAIGRFTITNTAIATGFATNDLLSIQNGFQQFDPTIAGTFVLDNIATGVFQTSESYDTKNSSNPGYGGSTVYAVLYKGATIATATELFVAELNSTFPTDPEVGAPLAASVQLQPATVANLVVGTVGANHDYGFGSGPLPTFQLSAVTGIPEPSRLMLLGLGGLGLFFRRRRC